MAVRLVAVYFDDGDFLALRFACELSFPTAILRKRVASVAVPQNAGTAYPVVV